MNLRESDLKPFFSISSEQFSELLSEFEFTDEMLHYRIYPCYDISWGGAFLGLGYGFIDAFMGFFLLAWLYNKL